MHAVSSVVYHGIIFIFGQVLSLQNLNMGEPGSPEFDLYFDVAVDVFGAMESPVVKQHKQQDITEMLRSASERFERLQISVQPYSCIEPSHPESFDDCKHDLAVRGCFASD